MINSALEENLLDAADLFQHKLKLHLSLHRVNSMNAPRRKSYDLNVFDVSNVGCVHYPGDPIFITILF